MPTAAILKSIWASVVRLDLSSSQMYLEPPFPAQAVVVSFLLAVSHPRKEQQTANVETHSAPCQLPVPPAGEDVKLTVEVATIHTTPASQPPVLFFKIYLIFNYMYVYVCGYICTRVPEGVRGGGGELPGVG